jgi:hypothetical protein
MRGNGKIRILWDNSNSLLNECIHSTVIMGKEPSYWKDVD